MFQGTVYMTSRISRKYRGVHQYAVERQKTHHDVYGWFPSPSDGQPAAVLQIDPDADEGSFPSEIGGVTVRLWKQPAPSTY